MVRVPRLKVIFAFKDTFHADGTVILLFFLKKHLYFICLILKKRISLIYILYSTYVVVFFLPPVHFQGRHRTHTGYRCMQHLHCCLHSAAGELAGITSSRQRHSR